jgi:F0F1-type ATP synthase membrane subunit c/vacuolar-type H+-ATPase subunit K
MRLNPKKKRNFIIDILIVSTIVLIALVVTLLFF